MARLRRTGWRLAVPVVLAAAICGGVRFGLSRTGSADWQRVEAWLIDASANVGLKVADIRVEGRETTDRRTIFAALGAGLGTPILRVDPVRARQQLEALPWVRSAAIERRLPDTLIVRLVERKPLALWQHNGKLDLIDRTGSVIPVTRLDRFAKLPMVVGEDAAGHAAELLAMLATEPDLAARVTAAIRVAGRRWNLQIDNAIDVLLPAEQTAAAWDELARIERSSAILKRDVRAIDLRLPDRLVVRVAPSAPIATPAAKKGRPSAKST
jgi:cell division protein FtsQ